MNSFDSMPLVFLKMRQIKDRDKDKVYQGVTKEMIRTKDHLNDGIILILLHQLSILLQDML